MISNQVFSWDTLSSPILRKEHHVPALDEDSSIDGTIADAVGLDTADKEHLTWELWRRGAFRQESRMIPSLHRRCVPNRSDLKERQNGLSATGTLARLRVPPRSVTTKSRQRSSTPIEILPPARYFVLQAHVRPFFVLWSATDRFCDRLCRRPPPFALLPSVHHNPFQEFSDARNAMGSYQKQPTQVPRYRPFPFTCGTG